MSLSRSSRQTLIGLGGFLLILLVIAGLASSANENKGLRADVLSARRGEPGQPVAFTISVRDTKGRVTGVEVDFGDGKVETTELGGERCGSPLNRNFDFTHTYDFTGYTTVAARVRTAGCGAEAEKVEAIRTLEIKDVRR